MIQILEKVHTALTGTEPALKKCMWAVTAIISGWKYVYAVRLNEDMKARDDKAFCNKMDSYDLCKSAIPTTGRMLHHIQW